MTRLKPAVVWHILKHRAWGNSSSAIAAKLGCSPRQVEQVIEREVLRLRDAGLVNTAARMTRGERLRGYSLPGYAPVPIGQSRPGKRHNTFAARNEAIAALRAAGRTLTAIALEFGISRERVRQIVQKAVPGQARKRPPRVILPVGIISSQELGAFIVAALKSGRRHQTVAQRLGLSADAVRAYRDWAGPLGLGKSSLRPSSRARLEQFLRSSPR